MADASEQADLEREFFNILRAKLSFWKIENSEKWVKALVAIIEKVIKDFCK